MKLTAVLEALEKSATEQDRMTCLHHRAIDSALGSDRATLRDLAGRHAGDAPLAMALWSTGDHDARVLACLITDPATLDAATADGWLEEADCFALCGQVADVVARSPLARLTCERWWKAPADWHRAAGWAVATSLAANATVDDAWCELALARVAREHASAPERTREQMSRAVIAIGARPSLRDRAVEVARATGAV